MAADGECKELDVRVEHLVPDCHSDVLMKGVASGTGYGSFDGMVYVAQDAQRTEAYQQSRNLLMGDRARIVTSPGLKYSRRRPVPATGRRWDRWTTMRSITCASGG